MGLDLLEIRLTGGREEKAKPPGRAHQRAAVADQIDVDCGLTSDPARSYIRHGNNSFCAEG